MKNRSHRYDINRTRPRYNKRICKDKYTKYKMCFSMMMVTCNKQHLSNIWSWIHEKVSNTEAELKKNVAYKKQRGAYNNS